ncbi:MAG: hypothetical protein AB4041_10240 [Microcystaceae cyanobacterium]
MLKQKFHQAFSLIIAVSLWAIPFNAYAQTWQPVSSGILRGISGMALIKQQKTETSFLIVHDNKKAGEQRVALITVTKDNWPIYEPIKWESEDIPIDLEALTNIPNQPNQFLALASRGKIYHIQLSKNNESVNILRVFDLPDGYNQGNFEGFALQEVKGVVIATWASRGKSQNPAILYWSKFDLATDTFDNKIQSVSLKMPWPQEDVRHVSDIKIDPSGAVFVSSAMDTDNNDGPFASAFYLAGTLQLQPNQIAFIRSENPVPLLRFYYHKVEGFELLRGEKGGIIFGTDDENFGSFVYSTQ